MDLRAQHREVEGEIARGFARVIEESSFILGGEVGRFEESFARYCGVPYCVGVANGTDALELVLRASGVGPGDEVILPANTFIATALAVARAGARPVLVDCDERHQLVDVASAADRVTKRTRAVIVVDLFGQVGPFEEASRLAEAQGCLVFEDAAQAQGARQHGRAAGSFGLAAGTSFYPGKNLGAYGDAGAVLTGSDEIARRVRALRNYGSDLRYHHPETGFNSRLDSLQAVVPERQAPAARGMERRARSGRGPLRELLVETCRASPSLRPPRETSTSGICTWCRSPGATRCCAASRRRGSARASTIPFPSTCRALSATWGMGAGRSP